MPTGTAPLSDFERAQGFVAAGTKTHPVTGVTGRVLYKPDGQFVFVSDMNIK